MKLHGEEALVLPVSEAVIQHMVGLLICYDQAKTHQTGNNERLIFIRTNRVIRDVADQTVLVLCVDPELLSQSDTWIHMAVLQSLPDRTVWENQSQHISGTRPLAPSI